MPAPETETPAIVLDCRDHGESDKIVTFLCPAAGRFAGIAKGAKRSKRRFVNKLELFSLLHLTCSFPRHGGLAFIAAAELESGFLNLRKNIELYNAASVIRECILAGTSEKEPSEKIFEILLWALQSLDDMHPGHTVVILFLLRFFEYIGYRPDLLRCHHCGRAPAMEQTSEFNYMTGCLICRACSNHSIQTTVPLSPGTIRILANAQNQPLERLHRLQFSPWAQKESLNMLHHFGRQLLQREIHSWNALFDQEIAGIKAPNRKDGDFVR
jgi:DNA repair protein RecO (recombination protein O)